MFCENIRYTRDVGLSMDWLDHSTNIRYSEENKYGQTNFTLYPESQESDQKDTQNWFKM